MRVEKSRSLRKAIYLARSSPGEVFYDLPTVRVVFITKIEAKAQYPSSMFAQPKSPEAALKEGVELAKRLNRERLGGQGKILGVRKSVEGGDYVIWMEVPLEIYKDLDLTTEIGAEVLELSDRLGVPFFLYFVPPGYSGYFG